MPKQPIPTDQAILGELAKLNGTLHDILEALQKMKESLDKIANRKP